MYSEQIANYDQLQALNAQLSAIYNPVQINDAYLLVNLDQYEVPTLGLQNLSPKNVIDRVDVAKGSKVNMDFSKGAAGSLVKSGKMGNIHDLHIKQGKGTGVQEIQNISGITKDNLKDAYHKAKSGTVA